MPCYAMLCNAMLLSIPSCLRHPQCQIKSRSTETHGRGEVRPTGRSAAYFQDESDYQEGQGGGPEDEQKTAVIKLMIMSTLMV